MKLYAFPLTLLALVSTSDLLAQSGQNVAPVPITYEQLLALPVPVTASDIVGKPYQVIGSVEAGVRKATVFSPAPSEKKVYKELWERGEKLKADAVINATYGDSTVTLLSWGERRARGTAIKFLNSQSVEPASVENK